MGHQVEATEKKSRHVQNVLATHASLVQTLQRQEPLGL